MVIITSYEFFERVYLKTDVDQQVRIITDLTVHPAGGDRYQVIYQLSIGAYHSHHYEEEFSREKDQEKLIL